MKKFIAILIIMSTSIAAASSRDNSLMAVKVISLPASKVRVDFRFAKPLKQLPASFIMQQPPRLILDFINSDLQLSLEQKTQQVLLGSLNSYGIVAVGHRVRVVLELSRTVSYTGSVFGSVYSLVINGRNKELLEPKKEVLITNQIVNAKHTLSHLDFRGIEKQGGSEEMQQRKLKKQVGTGKRISLNFQNINIRAVLQLLADFTGTNMVVSENVKGDITLRLNDTPWDQVLDIILTMQGLDKRRTGNVMLIDTKVNLDKIEESKLKSQQIIQKLEPLRSDLLQINYAKSVDLAVLIKDKQNSLLSERGKISVDARTNTIWIQDTGAKIEEVRKLIKQLDVPVKQVLIEARIVDVSKDFSQDIGIRWGISRPPALSAPLEGADQVQQNFAAGHVNPVAAAGGVLPFADRLNLDLVAAPINLANPATLGIALAKINDNILLDLELSALESEGRAELISSPRLITINQQSALIESGQEIPYQEATLSGATAVAFKKAVLSLKVTPQITPDGKILMDLQINQDTTSPQTFNGVPAILTKEIQTNVLVNNGQTIVLGGIYTQDKAKTMNRIPFFGELPVVGVLFRNKRTNIKNNELLIFITPKIIANSLSMTTIEDREKEVYK